MKQPIDLRVDPETAATPHLLKTAAAKAAGIEPECITAVEILRRSIDARQRRVAVNLRVRLRCVDDHDVDEVSDFVRPVFNHVADDAPRVVVVGSGPAGLFAALRLIELGIRPVVLERGKDVDSRRKDLAGIARTGTVDGDSNYAFGEGGAGTFSDGKLFTRSKKRGSVEEILHILHVHGAPDDILVDAHPHIGTNLLPDIIKSMRQTIERCGGEVHFGTRVTELLFDDTKTAVTGVKTADGKTFEGEAVILATGHSARDVYEFLHDADIRLEAKGIAVGVRVEHPAELIDRIMYHTPEGRGKFLPAAEYSMLTRVDGRAVYSFCMCPGGVIVPAASGPNQIVVNGMSPSNRGTRWSNSGMVVEVLPEDVPGDDELRVMRFQAFIERMFYYEAGGRQNAPAQRMTDFVYRRDSRDLPSTSYAPGIHPARIDKHLPRRISQRLRKGFEIFGKKYPGFLTSEATIIGPETRTSAPVRLPRDPSTLEHVQIKGLYPAGEGAGYAGGIVSAAIDGRRCADAFARSRVIGQGDVQSGFESREAEN